MSKLHKLSFGVSEREAVAADRVLEGAPMTETRIDYQMSETMFVGEWSSTVGAWCIAYDEWEYCEMLEGACELVAEGGATQRFTTGDSFVIEPGFKGVWRVTVPMRKKFVIRIV